MCKRTGYELSSDPYPASPSSRRLMMDASELLACLVFAGYFALILLSFFFVFKSILHGVQAKELLDSRPFLFLRIAVVALGCTWYCQSALSSLMHQLTLSHF